MRASSVFLVVGEVVVCGVCLEEEVYCVVFPAGVEVV